MRGQLLPKTHPSLKFLFNFMFETEKIWLFYAQRGNLKDLNTKGGSRIS